MVQATFLESCTCAIVILWWEYVNCEIEMTSKLFFNLSRTVFVERMMHPRRPRGRIVGARESLNGWKNKAQKKSKERPEEALGTMSYQTSSKRSPPFWLLIGARKTQVFWHQSEDIVPRGSSGCSLLFFVPYFSTRLDFPSPHYLPLGLQGWEWYFVTNSYGEFWDSSHEELWLPV